ncbi:UNVERIFIED_CONTAM: hypothetical protein GTU68_008618 [Idotea baltica]|nr:hypothetical protein [Idotea baltica]
MRDNSEKLFTKAQHFIPGGVNSPVRAFRGVGGTPVFMSRGEGARLIDEDGKDYIDYICSWGPQILGHQAPLVTAAIQEALNRSTSFGAPTEAEVSFAEFLVNRLDALEMVRMVNSGTEATMSAARLARGFTGRDMILKFNGCYHGHADFFLVEAGSGAATQGISGSAGVPSQTAALTLSIEYNDLDLLRDTLKKVGAEKFAAIIVEPVAGNMGLIVPDVSFLQGLREVCDEHGILLIFDEVMSGFRVAFGGAAERFAVIPDLVTYGKVIGGGLPVGAFGGRKDVMKSLAPLGPVYQAGTLSGNPLAMAAGRAVIGYLSENDPYPLFEERSSRLISGLIEAAQRHGFPMSVQACGSMFGFFFSDSKVKNFSDAKASDTELFKQFFQQMLERGIYLAPSAFEAGFLSICHGEEEIAKTIQAADDSFKELRESC